MLKALLKSGLWGVSLATFIGSMYFTEAGLIYLASVTFVGSLITGAIAYHIKDDWK